MTQIKYQGKETVNIEFRACMYESGEMEVGFVKRVEGSRTVTHRPSVKKAKALCSGVVMYVDTCCVHKVPNSKM